MVSGSLHGASRDPVLAGAHEPAGAPDAVPRGRGDRDVAAHAVDHGGRRRRGRRRPRVMMPPHTVQSVRPSLSMKTTAPAGTSSRKSPTVPPPASTGS